MSDQEAADTNPQCRPSQQSETDELAEFHKTLSTDFDVLPLFERQYSDYVRIRQYSMANNEKLRTRFHERVMSERGPQGPKTMPNINDYHFHNSRTKFLPSQSQCNYPPPRLHLAPGPGVDKYGQRPIPDDMTLKKPNPNPPPKSGKQKTKNLKKERRVPKK